METPVALKTATFVLSLVGTPAELGELFRAYVDATPGCVIRAVGARVDLVGQFGGSQPHGVAPGMVFFILTRSLFSARLSWFEFLDLQRVFRRLCGLRLTSPGFEKVASPDAFDAQCGHLPAQPGDKSRVLGVNSFAQSPAFGGNARKDISHECG